MVPRTLVLCVFMAFITASTDSSSAGCAKYDCGKLAYQFKADNVVYHEEARCGEPTPEGPNSSCQVICLKNYYRCGGCGNVTYKNKKNSKEHKRGCSHTTRRLFTPESQQSTAAASIYGASSSGEGPSYVEIAGGHKIQYFQFFREKPPSP
ncbi:hypothetical protein PGT21_031193 [Puccinia graminis f. sp. tritici]|uniref:C2H2-type domain-containing protein n=1 Tax=Puccinia graminis f. sp. tritici TaxID=56615 RepID=A0A5B0QJW8_PUCGR|nr:hypothetical protein PGT21_031193 [Puccinia graminis f. sp. tritici]